MDEPWTTARNPPTPDFAKARRQDEHERQQRIASLTPDQKQQFEQLRRDQQQQQKELTAQQQERWRGRMAEEMRKSLLQDRGPHLQPGSPRRQLKDSQDLRNAIEDYLDGRSNRMANAYKSELHRAYRVARSNVIREQNRERGQLRKDQTTERDAFLSRAERERGEKAPQKSQENAKDGGARRDDRGTEKSPYDSAWQRAFSRAAAKEAHNEKDIENNKGHDSRDDPGKTR